jgi:uncharacterized protein (DUF433 family)
VPYERVKVRKGSVAPGIETDRERCGGRPCVADTRVTVAQILAELAEGGTVRGVASDMDISHAMISLALRSLTKIVDGWRELPEVQK